MEKNAEVVICGASIMKDVWEIRLREYRQKRQIEEERMVKSALERINQDWQLRMTSKIKAPKRLERKAKLPDEPTLDEHKPKKPYLGRPQGFQSSRIQKQVDQKKTPKGNKLALLRHLTESSPGLMIWAKAWKFAQPLQQTQESPSTFDWGQSWKFFNLQPKTDGKPWFDDGFDANNDMSSNYTFLWEKNSKPLRSECFQQDLVTPEWEKSWIFTQKRKESCEGTENWKNKLFDFWRESSQDWCESWKATKPNKEGNIKPDLNQPTTNEEKQSELTWKNAWMYFKKQLYLKSEGNNEAWSESWRVAKTISEQEKSTQSHAAVPGELHPNICNVIMNVSREMKHTIQFGGRDVQLSEWQKSWMTIKNLSEYKEELNKAEHREEEVKVETPKPDNRMQQSEQVKFIVFSAPKNKKQPEIRHFSNEIDWKDSWKMLKRQRREERALRNQRPPQLVSAPQALTDWANSWRFTNLTLNQDESLWRQGWSINTQPRPVRRVQINEEFPHNGPAAIRAWSESWRSMRRQHLSERQGPAGSTQPVRRHMYSRSVEDWEQSWNSTTYERNHYRPSMTEWADSWRFSSVEDLRPDHSWFEKSMEIKGRKELVKASNALSRSFESQMFKERYPPKVWNDSWKITKKSDGSGVAHLMRNEFQDWDNSWMFTSTGFYQRKGECYVNVRQGSDARSCAALQSVQMENSSAWGRSWKMSNPHPPKSIASWVNAKPRSFNAQEMILWSKPKRANFLPYGLAKDVKLKTWSKAWRFMKMNVDSVEGESGKRKKTDVRKHLYVNIDQLKPHEKKWSDACKLAKTQPRPKRNVKAKAGPKDEEKGKGMFAEWTDSWKLSNDLKSNMPAVVSISVSDWGNSWKFLLDPYTPVNGPKTNKSR